MKRNYLTPLIEIMDPNNLPSGIIKLGEINDALNYEDEIYAFYRQGDFLSVVDHSVVKPHHKPPYLSIRQFDAPLAILPWFFDKLVFFRKSSVEGGLAPNRIATDKELIGGEHLILSRAMDAGNARREGGYMIENINRKAHSIRSSNFQDLLFSDSFLFEGGMLDLWKDLADKYKAGTL